MSLPKTSNRHLNLRHHQPELIAILKLIEAEGRTLNQDKLNQILRLYPKDGRGYFSKSQLIYAYRYFAGHFGLKPYDEALIGKIKMKPTRTISGVTPVTVLTKPYPCPGKCIFCPNDVRMPKSYLSSEPGAQRAEKNFFDPYLQTYNRLQAYKDIGHNYQKVELIVLGGTWSIYPAPYKIWFVKRMFEALNDFGQGLDQRAGISPSLDVSHIVNPHKNIVIAKNRQKNTYNQVVTKLYLDQELPKLKSNNESSYWDHLFAEQARNQSAQVRCVGLVLETRPDYISEDEIIMLRKFGCTKTQIGLQSLQDNVLSLNHRGHDVAASRRAMQLLRQAGLKIHVHWMPNLYGSSVEKDIKDYQTLFTDPDFKPDEIKIYPCSLIEKTDLVNVYNSGDWRPYTHQELLEVLVNTLKLTPEYCRVTRVVRDIPSNDILKGNKLTNFRQIAEAEAGKRHYLISDIRHREIRHQDINSADLVLKTLCYKTSVSIEYFFQFVTPINQIAGFLRLSLPSKPSFIEELANCAIIREVHVYGQALNIGTQTSGEAQHLGLGKFLIKTAEETALSHQSKKLAVISAIGTREYYEKQGYVMHTLYQIKSF